MPKTLRFHPQVVSDLTAAIAWYEQRSLGLGNRFRSAVRAQFDFLRRTPDLAPPAFPDVDFPFVRLRRFPYLVLYRIGKDTVQVIGVFHSASDPKKWRSRAKI